MKQSRIRTMMRNQWRESVAKCSPKNEELLKALRWMAGYATNE